MKFEDVWSHQNMTCSHSRATCSSTSQCCVNNYCLCTTMFINKSTSTCGHRELLELIAVRLVRRNFELTIEVSQLEKVKFCLYPDFCRNRHASPSSTSTPNFKLQDYLEVPDRDAQREALFSSVLSYER